MNEKVYYRGVRYYQSNAVSNVTWSKGAQQYRGNVQGGSGYTVTIDVKDEYSFDYACNCPAHLKYEGACKHVVALLLFVEDYIGRSEAQPPKTPEEKQICSIIEYFNKREDTILYGETFRLEVTIGIPTLMKGSLGKAFVSLQAGNNRVYKVQSIKKFLNDYYNRKDITLGKEFKFIHGESQFDKKSMKILDYLLEIYEIQEALGKVYYSNLFSKSEIVITQNMMIKFLDCIGDRGFTLDLYGTTYNNVHFLKENPPIRFDMEIEEDAIKIDIEKNQNVIPLTENGSLLYLNQNVYLPELSFIKNYVPFYNCLGNNKKPLRFQGDNKNKFLEMVFPRIQETMNVQIPEEMKENYIIEKLKTSIYLDRHKLYIKAKVVFGYGAYELNPLDIQYQEGVIIQRKKETENVVLQCLDQMNFVPYKDYFLLKKEEDIYYFLSEGITELTKDCEIFYSEDFKNITVRNPGTLSAGVRINEKSDLLEVDMTYDEIPQEELKEFFHSLQLKRKYFRLKNGGFINLEHENIKVATSILKDLHISTKNIQETGLVFDKSYAMYINSFMEDGWDLTLEKDSTFIDFVDHITNPKETDFRIPEGIKAELRGYQITGYKWLKTLAMNNLGGILADDMGLGKTLQTIVYIASCPDKLHLVVCPSSLVYNWQDEFLNFAPFLRTVIISGKPEERKERIQHTSEVDVIITSYPLLRRDIEIYKELEFDSMFIDEAQFIKNPGSQNAKSVKKIQTKHKFALTGTPIENSLSELWSIFDYVMPKYLLSHKSFIEQYEKPILKNEDTSSLEKLGKHIHPFILRRMKKDVLKELPEKVETKLVTELTEQQKKIYFSYLENIKMELNKEIEDRGIERSQLQILAALTRMRQICCHPATFIENYQGGSGKLNLLMEQLPNYIANNHRILIFSQFTSMLDLIKEELDKEGISYFYLEGATKIKDRNEYVKRFNQGEKSIFLISLKAGGTGLNLVGADTVIHYDPWWNPAVEEQATDRVYRIGQKNMVHVIKLITKGTIEEKIYKLQKRKKALSDSVMESKEIFINQLTKEELEEIFQP